MRPYIGEFTDLGYYHSIYIEDFEQIKKIYSYLVLVGIKNLELAYVGNPYKKSFNKDYLLERGWWAFQPILKEDIKEAIEVIWPTN